ncbi:hypothetical protein SPF06_04435 [Sinomonas sp. JGH33]|uniref:Uncharacterized protein n=1 Tax=Sinomonas terricola TaxID=3110330 RepID=A0ABU5T2S3_9MICC|nr:hypothetical protein [Sinomonas sp. JGH33]MEA5453964.1 hypothetical protein [Sinomonas sp. JGH33]
MSAKQSRMRRVTLAEIVYRPLRMAVAALWLVGAALAGATAPIAAVRLNFPSALVFAVVAVAAVILAVSTLRGRKWALAIDVLGCAGQVLGVIGTVWELADPVGTAKSLELQALGFDPTVAVVINLAYSAVASLLFGWMAFRFVAKRRAARRAEPRAPRE